ncbi:MAG: hypothetical protein HY367_03625 [Candidatus Aenigmarchaeota archaeon]|nr:hypothetical protein [Candidatus Aenigmarchaeota archaeon]
MGRCHTAVLNWHGTLIGEPTEAKLWEQAGMYLLGKSIPFRPVRLVKLIGSASTLYDLTKEHKEGRMDYSSFKELMYQHFNPEVLHGTKRKHLDSILERYAEDAVSRLDRGIINVLGEFKANPAHSCEILSTGCKDAISAVLSSSGYGHVFDRIVANRFDYQRNGTVDRFNYNGVSKAASMRQKLDESKNKSGYLYMGDGLEDDEEIFGMLMDAGGGIAISPRARDDVKLSAQHKFGAFVGSPKELRRYLVG